MIKVVLIYGKSVLLNKTKKYDRYVFATDLICLQYPKIQWKNPVAFSGAIPCNANFQVVSKNTPTLQNSICVLVTCMHVWWLDYLYYNVLLYLIRNIYRLWWNPYQILCNEKVKQPPVCLVLTPEGRKHNKSLFIIYWLFWLCKICIFQLLLWGFHFGKDCHTSPLLYLLSFCSCRLPLIYNNNIICETSWLIKS